jgi:hypothetical protein
MFNICFIIAVKYYRNYKSYVQYYVDNIQKYYPNNYTILVDNNSKYIQDLVNIFKEYNNVIILINKSTSKFEIGAYNEGIRYVFNNDLLNTYDYFVFSQDNFVLKNKFDFNELYNYNILACSFNHWSNMTNYCNLRLHDSIIINILKKINVYERIDEYNLCWCNSFILHSSKINDYYDIVKDLIIEYRHHSERSERYLPGILYYLNNFKYESICGAIDNIDTLGYDCSTVDVINDNISRYFVKTTQQKNESTIDE